MNAFCYSTAKSRSFPAILATVVIATLGCSQVMQAASVRFLPLNQDIAERKIGIKDGKKILELKDLNAKKRSKAYTYTVGDSPLALVALDLERPNGNPASIEIPLTEGMKSPLVLIFPDANNPCGMRAVAVEDSDTGFPWGSLRFVNTTDGPLVIRYDKETKPVPESYAVVDVLPGGEARNMGVQLFAASEPDTVLYSAVWEHDPNLRKLIFIVNSGDTNNRAVSLAIIPQDRRSKN